MISTCNSYVYDEMKKVEYVNESEYEYVCMYYYLRFMRS